LLAGVLPTRARAAEGEAHATLSACSCLPAKLARRAHSGISCSCGRV